MLTISPGGDGNDTFSGERIRIRPGTDRFLVAAAIKLLAEKGNISPAVLEHTKRPQKFLDLISGCRLEDLTRACEVSPSDVQKLWRWYGQGKPVATFVGTGLQRYRYGGENTRFINALALLSGNIGIAGGGSYFHLHSYRNLNLTWTADPQWATWFPRGIRTMTSSSSVAETVISTPGQVVPLYSVSARRATARAISSPARP